LAFNPPTEAHAAHDVDEELMFHVRLLVEENRLQGMSDDEAWSSAHRRFGSVYQYAKETRRIDMGHRFTTQRLALGGLLVLGVLCGWLWLQVEQLHGQSNQILKLVQDKPAEEDRPEKMKSYPVKLSADDIREFPKLAVDFGKLQLRTDAVNIIPLSSKVGITGLVVIGNGKFHYAPEEGKEFDGNFRSILLRFNPKDLDTIVKLDEGKKVTDKGLYETARSFVNSTMRHSWQSNGDALIPPTGTMSADLYTQEFGDVLISFGENNAVVYNFSDRKELYEKK
jgi:hypothetical protein